MTHQDVGIGVTDSDHIRLMIAQKQGVYGRRDVAKRLPLPHCAVKAERTSGSPTVSAVTKQLLSRQQDEEATPAHQVAPQRTLREPPNRLGEKSGMIIIVIVQFLDNASPRSFDTNVQLRSCRCGLREPYVSNTIEIPAQASGRFIAVVHDHQFGVYVRLAKKAAKGLPQKGRPVPSRHDAGHQPRLLVAETHVSDAFKQLC